jgi:uncharacterized protein YbjT (DUF2867 family)
MARALLGENLEHMVGDTRRPDTVHSIMQGVHTVICATGTREAEGMNSPRYIDYEGVSNLVQAAVAAGASRFLLVSSIGVTHPEHPLNKMGQVLMWKGRGEEAVRESGIPYTIVRPGGLTDEPGGMKPLLFGQGDKISGRISRADVAEVCLRALQQPEALNTTFEVIESESDAIAGWDALFASLTPDSKVESNA